MGTLLFVCTGNICRSPMAEAIARRELSQLSADARVTSAGLLPAGRQVPWEVAEVMEGMGLDVSAHRSRRLEDALDAALAEPPEVILAMAREHARAVVEHDAGLFERVFTLKDLVRRATAAGRRMPGEPMEEYLRRVGNGRGFASLAGASRADDVADPIGADLKTYRRCVAEIQVLTRTAIAQLRPGIADSTRSGGSDRDHESP